MVIEMTPEPILSIESGRVFHVLWGTICGPLDDLMLNKYLIDRYFSVHLTTKIGDVKLSTNVVYGRNAASEKV